MKAEGKEVMMELEGCSAGLLTLQFVKKCVECDFKNKASFP